MASSSSSFKSHRSSKSESHKRERKITPDAFKVLCKLPGVKPSLLNNWLHSARVLEHDDRTYRNILRYVRNGQLHGYGIQVLNIVRVVRDGVIEFDRDAHVKNRFRMILWHGTTQDKIASILHDGFKVPNDKGQMFGTGLYFADRISKSANYCGQGFNPAAGSTAFLLLCDVFLGNVYNSKNPKNGMKDTPPGKYDSVMCTGKHVPDRTGNRKIRKSILPCGPTIANTKFPSYTLEHNEYIVYDPDKIRIKYLVEIKFHSTIL